MKLVPAILVHDLATYRARLSVVKQLTNRFQLDVIDGEYADNKTIGLDEIQPLGGELRMDLHLMVVDPMKYAELAVRLRPYLTIFQLEGGGDIEGAIAKLKKTDLKVGLAINPDTDVEALKPFAQNLTQVLLLSVKAGFSGQEFQPKVLKKVADIRAHLPFVEIGIDGGVNAQNLKQITESDIDIAYVNSALFEADDPLSRYSELMEATL